MLQSSFFVFEKLSRFLFSSYPWNYLTSKSIKSLIGALLLLLLSPPATAAEFYHDTCSQAIDACIAPCEDCYFYGPPGTPCVVRCRKWARRYSCRSTGEAHFCNITCPVGQTVNRITGQCEFKYYCPPPFSFSADRSQCHVYCGADQTWDASQNRCVSPTVADSCGTISRNPVDFIQGKKYLNEKIIGVGEVFPIELIYHYNNQRNSEKTHLGVIASTPAAGGPAATMTPLIYNDYNDQYANSVLDIDMEMGLKPAYGNITRYWRHSYEEALLPRPNGGHTLYQGTGTEITFDSAGLSAAYPAVSLRVLSATEVTAFGFAGHMLEQGATKPRKLFDDLGRLRRLINTNGLYHELSYAANSVDITRIAHSINGHIDFTYAGRITGSIYSLDHIASSYPTKLTDHTGRVSTLSWDHIHYGASRTYRMLINITSPYIGRRPASMREFEYGDANWPTAITQVFDRDIIGGTRKLYASFQYDTDGRVIYSGLAGGADAITIAYPDSLTRRVTNSLGKAATYRFAEFNNVRRLQSVTGEPTANCIQSATLYQYDSAGNISQMNRNGQITVYSHNSRGLETSRTEAAGTPQARTITTEWHAELALPLKTTTPESITVFTYDSAGRLLTRTLSAPPLP